MNLTARGKQWGLRACAWLLMTGIVPALGLPPLQQAEAEPVQRRAEAHQHGAGNLNIIVDKDKLLIELSAPGADLAGIEHRPTTKADHAAIAAARTKLRDTGRLFTFSKAAKCTPRFVDVDYGGHEGGHETDHGGEDAHAEFHAVYELACASLGDLKSISTRYFELFPNGKQLTVRVVGELVQSKSVITAKDPVIRF